MKSDSLDFGGSWQTAFIFEIFNPAGTLVRQFFFKNECLCTVFFYIAFFLQLVDLISTLRSFLDRPPLAILTQAKDSSSAFTKSLARPEHRFRVLIDDCGHTFLCCFDGCCGACHAHLVTQQHSRHRKY
jgi:hypothetical protein